MDEILPWPRAKRLDFCQDLYYLLTIGKFCAPSPLPLMAWGFVAAKDGGMGCMILLKARAYPIIIPIY
jgi:hypothetical protein